MSRVFLNFLCHQCVEPRIQFQWRACLMSTVSRITRRLNNRKTKTTDDHKRIQNMFLDMEFRAKFIRVAAGIDVCVPEDIKFELDAPVGEGLAARSGSVYDVVIEDFAVTIKTMVMDEYPHVLRTMKARMVLEADALQGAALDVTSFKEYLSIRRNCNGGRSINETAFFANDERH